LDAARRPDYPASTMPASGPSLTVPRILWGALLVSTALFLGVLAWSQHSGATAASPEQPMMFPAMSAAALMVAAMSFVVPRMIHHNALRAAKLPVEEVDDPDAVGMFRSAAAKQRVFADPKRARSLALAIYMTPFILGMALGEAISLFGFILGFNGSALLHVVPFWILCWLLFALRFPTEARALRPLETVYDATLSPRGPIA
jgi:F0F1-type ATP synthase membrane subunit c/vacuolar-type H+-ATPase subunit K